MMMVSGDQSGDDDLSPKKSFQLSGSQVVRISRHDWHPGRSFFTVQTRCIRCVNYALKINFILKYNFMWDMPHKS